MSNSDKVNVTGNCCYYLKRDGSISKTKVTPVYQEWYNDIKNRIIRSDMIEEIDVTTSFIGFEVGKINDRPILFDTIVRGDDSLTKKYSTLDSAIEGHKKTLEELKNKIKSCNQ